MHFRTLTKFKKVPISCFGRDQSILQWLPFSLGQITSLTFFLGFSLQN